MLWGEVTGRTINCTMYISTLLLLTGSYCIIQDFGVMHDVSSTSDEASSDHHVEGSPFGEEPKGSCEL